MNGVTRFKKIGMTFLATIIILSGMLSFNNEKASAAVQEFFIFVSSASNDKNYYTSDVWIVIDSSSGNLAGRSVRWSVTNSSGTQVASGSKPLRYTGANSSTYSYDIGDINFRAPGGTGTNYKITYSFTVGTMTYSNSENFVIN